MQILENILKGADVTEIIGKNDIKIAFISSNSAELQPNGIFIAVKGTKTDGHNFIPQAIKNGAIAIVCENIPENNLDNITFIRVKDSSYALGIIASNFYDNPSSKLNLIGITGTNGKTTTVTLLHKLFKELGYKTGLLSTVSNIIDEEVIPARLTTPDAVSLNNMLHSMVEKGCTYCFMEVTSHAVIQNRVAGLKFAGGIFSNITHDHLDYHQTFDNYLKAKKQFFDTLETDAFALVNIDDRNGEVMVQNTKAKKYTYALNCPADYKCKVLENQFTGLHLNIDGNEVWFRLAGIFNAYNILAIYSVASLLGESKTEILRILSSLKPVEGRFDYVRTDDNITAVIDFAHTPDALQNILTTINSTRNGNERIITVIGAGGDRDKTKRPIMAKIAYELSDKVIITSDNPRSEDPAAIIADMMAGIEKNYDRKVISIINRKEAIRTACSFAFPGDIILVAGKGHEKYQEINGIRHPFDDKQIIMEFLFS